MTGTPPQALVVEPQEPPALQLALATRWLATHVPPPVHVPAVPGAVQTVPALPELEEQRPEVLPAVHTLLHSSSGSSRLRQPPPGHWASLMHGAPGTLER